MILRADYPTNNMLLYMIYFLNSIISIFSLQRLIKCLIKLEIFIYMKHIYSAVKKINLYFLLDHCTRFIAQISH